MPFNSDGHNLIRDGGNDKKVKPLRYLLKPFIWISKSSTLLLIDAINMEYRGQNARLVKNLHQVL